MLNKLISSEKFWQIVTLFFVILFVVGQVSPDLLHFSKAEADSSGVIVKTVHASEIHEKFSCSCCNQPLDSEEPCCGIAASMISFIDQKIENGFSDEEIILEAVREFGLERIIDKGEREEAKQRLIALAPEDAPKIELMETSRDLGEVRPSQGVVTSDFEFKNTGESDLVISKLSSSCGCTSGAVIYGGEEGPRFYMEGHGHDNPGDWEVAIKPGDSAILRIYYDPLVHPDFVGAATRLIKIHSNDPVEFEKQVMINLEQIK